MTRVVQLEVGTRRLHRRWAALAHSTLGAAVVLAAAAGGPSTWVRLLLGAIAVVGCRDAIRLRRSLAPMVIAAAVMLAIVPDGSRFAPALVSLVGAILLLVASESAHVARRLVTAAPVTSTGRDAAALGELTVAAAFTAAVAAAVSWTDRWATEVLVVGLVVAALGVVAIQSRTRAAERPPHRR